MGRKKGSLSEEGPSTWNSHIRTVYKKLKCFQSYNNPNKKVLLNAPIIPLSIVKKPAHNWVLFVVSHKSLFNMVAFIAFCSASSKSS